MGLTKIILEASIFVILFASSTIGTIDPNTILSSPIVDIPTETTENAELPSNIDTSNIFNPEGIINNEPLKIQYIPVGNGEAILITAQGKTMLLDGGENTYEKQFLNYLRNSNISKIDYLIITNPVDQNIGVLDKVIKDFEVENIYSLVIDRNTPDYNNLLQAMSDKNKSFKIAKQYNQFAFADGLVTFLHVDNNATNIDNASIVINLNYRGKDFLFASNINKETEQKISWQSADVLKIASKGKSIATEYIFLAKVKPKISIIIRDNEPYDEKIKINLKKLNSKLLFSDTNKIAEITYDGITLEDKLVQNTIYD